mmetsp:Transcript_10295/g.37943  ORF Transcript_10295/g.37943 Transcript_10295/m.37943 type:complete len:144 (-) Transcript_10295:344-775(-)
MQLSKILARRFPDVEIVPSNFEPPFARVAMAKAVGYAQMGTIGLTLFGEKLFPLLGVAEPQGFAGLKDNKFQVVLVAWILGNTISQNMMNTGAFEVFYNGEQLFSKVATGQLPNVQDLIMNIESEMRRNKPDNPSVLPDASEE